MAAQQQRTRSFAFFRSPIAGVLLCALPWAGCGSLWGRPPDPPNPPLKIVVAPVTLEAAITRSTQIHSFDEAPGPESEPALLAQLVDEVQGHAQQFLTEHLARQNGFVVIPFDETRRTLGDFGPVGQPWKEDQLLALGRASDADFVVAGHILDYGAVRWQYWATGLVIHSSVGLAILGTATGWNPAALGAYAVYEIPDFFIWSGGAQIFGWTFRPIRIQVDAIQVKPCGGLVWSEQEAVLRVPGKLLEDYPPEAQGRKEIQLEANLKRVLADVADIAGRELRTQPCAEDGTPVKLKGISILATLDLLY